MRLAIFVISFVMLPIPLAAKIEVTTMGIGNKSCATWLATPSSEVEGVTWILGFWSGANWGTLIVGKSGVASGKVGITTDALGIVGEVKKHCMNFPSQILATVVADIFNEFLAAGK